MRCRSINSLTRCRSIASPISSSSAGRSWWGGGSSLPARILARTASEGDRIGLSARDGTSQRVQPYAMASGGLLKSGDPSLQGLNVLSLEGGNAVVVVDDVAQTMLRGPP